MLPPANDNWLGVTPIAEGPAQAYGTTAGASAEPDEPANHGRTVWFSWRSPNTPYLEYWKFHTQAPPGQDAARTVVQVFYNPAARDGGSSLAQLREVAQFGDMSGITLPDTEKYGFASQPSQVNIYERGGEVSFLAVRDWTYFIRVDGLSGSEGPFELHWTYHSTVKTLLDFGGAPFRPGIMLPGIERYVNHATAGANGISEYFGILPPGRYVMRYVGGAWIRSINATRAEWMAIWEGSAYAWPYCWLVIGDQEHHFNAAWNPYFWNGQPAVPPIQGGLPQIYALGSDSYEATTWWTWGAKVEFTLTEAKEVWLVCDPAIANESQDYRNWKTHRNFRSPTFVLNQVRLYLEVATVRAAWRPWLAGFACELSFRNLTHYAWDGIQCQLFNNGVLQSAGTLGMTADLAAVTSGMSLPMAVTPTPAAWASAFVRVWSTESASGTFRDFPLALAPVLIVSEATATPVSECGGDGQVLELALTITNRGNADTQAAAVRITDLGSGIIELLDLACTPMAEPWEVSLGVIPAVYTGITAGTAELRFRFRIPPGATTARLLLALADGGYALGTCERVVTW